MSQIQTQPAFQQNKRIIYDLFHVEAFKTQI